MAEIKTITAREFAGKAWKNPGSFRFAAKRSLLPIVAAELAQVVPAYPLAFVKHEQSWRIGVLASLLPDQNLLITPEGKWLGGYIPAVLRAYPFRLMRTSAGGEAVLGIVNDAEWLAASGEGQPFFAEDGKQPSPAIQEVLTFLQGMEASRESTQKAVDVLAAADLLVQWDLRVNVAEVEKSVEGLFRIDEQALNKLPADKLASLRDAGGLTLAYGQLFSTVQLPRLQRAASAQEQLRATTAAANPFEGLGVVAGDTLKFNP